MSTLQLRLQSHRWLPILVLLLAIISLQSGASLAKSLFPIIGAPGMTAWRLGIGTLILCLFFKPWRLKLKRPQFLPLLIYGLALGAMNYLFYLALRTVPLGIAVALEFIGPLSLALFSSRQIQDFIWVTLAVSGLWFLLPLGHNIAGVDVKGAALAMGAGACWAVYILAGQKAGAEHGLATVAIGSVIAAIVFVPLGLHFSENNIWQLSLIPTALAIAILSTVLPYSLEMIALTRLPARTFSIMMSLEPAMAAISGMLFLGEMLTPIQWMALLSIITASAGAALTRHPKRMQIKQVKNTSE